MNIAQVRAIRTCPLASPASTEISFGKSVDFDRMPCRMIVREIRGMQQIALHNPRTSAAILGIL
jgi:hypothetical protein